MNSTLCVASAPINGMLFGSASPSLYYEPVDEVDGNGNTLLHLAVLQGIEDKVKYFIYRGFDVNKQNFEGQTPLYIACLSNFSKIVQILLKAGANANIGNIDGATPVHVVAANGYTEVLSMLAQHGSFLNSQDEDGDTPLHYAIREGQKKIVEDLVKVYKADVSLKNDDLETPLQLALCLNETTLVQLLAPNVKISFGEEYGHGGNWRSIRV